MKTGINFNLKSQPLLSRKAVIQSNSEKTFLSIGEDQLIFESTGAQELLCSHHLFDGMHTLEQISDSCKVDIDVLFSLSQTLSDDNLLIDTQAQKRNWANSSDFVSFLIKECSFWHKYIYEQSFWKNLVSGNLNRASILGWGIETMHYVEAANEYMALGIAYCREDIKTREMLSQHYAHEANHSQIFLKGLIASGLNEKLLVNAPPLASSRALINYLSEIAIQDTLPYTATFALMQSGNESASREEYETSYNNLIEKYPFAKGMFEAFLKHALIDIELKHNTTLFEEIFNIDREISRRESENAISVIRTLSKYFILFFDGIENYYSNHLCQLPRRQARINDLLI